MQLARLTILLTLFGNLSCGPVPELTRAVVNEADRAVPTPAPAPSAPTCVPITELTDALDEQYDKGYAAGRASVSCSCSKNKCTCN